jgi:hypothetical protein
MVLVITVLCLAARRRFLPDVLRLYVLLAQRDFLNHHSEQPGLLLIKGKGYV